MLMLRWYRFTISDYGVELGFNLHRYLSFPSSHLSGKQHAARAACCLPYRFSIIAQLIVIV
jgi:hypothetical protein